MTIIISRIPLLPPLARCHGDNGPEVTGTKPPDMQVGQISCRLPGIGPPVGLGPSAFLLVPRSLPHRAVVPFHPSVRRSVPHHAHQ